MTRDKTSRGPGWPGRKDAKIKGGPAPRVLKPRLERADNVERQELLTSLAHTRALIQQAYRGFNSAEDGDLIESYVFEINALQSRYNYLLRRVKELEAQP